MRHILGGNLHLLPRFGIAAGAGRPVIQPEAAEAANLDTLAESQALCHCIEDHLHREFGVLRHQLWIARRQLCDQLGLRHGRPYWSVLAVSSLALSSAPRLVVPALAGFSDAIFCIAADSSAISRALIDRLIARFLRSILMIMTVTGSPSFRCVRMSSTRSRATSEARRYPSMSPSSAITAPLGSIDLTVPVTMLFLS